MDKNTSTTPYYNELSINAPETGSYILPPPRTTSEEPWDTIITFDVLPVPDFPLAALPRWVREYVCKFSDYAQVSPDLVATFCLTVISSAVMGKYTVSPQVGYYEPVNLYALCVAESAANKGSIYRAAIQPLKKYESEIINAARIEIAKYNAVREMKKRNLDRLIKAASAPDAEPELAAQVELAAAELACMPERHPPCLLAENVTPEALERLMAEQGGKMTILAAEGGGIIGIMGGRYSGGQGHNEVYLQSFDHEDITVHRINRPPIYLKNPCLTIGLFCQPYVMQAFIGSPELREKGLVNRFLICYPRSNIGSRKFFRHQYVPDDIRNQYDANILALCHDGVTDETTGKVAESILQLSPKALLAFKTFVAEIEPRLGQDGSLNFIQGWAGKARGVCLRIAGILHMAESCHDLRSASATPISAKTMRNAIEIYNYYMGHAKAVFAAAGCDDLAHNMALAILDHIKRKNLNIFTKKVLMDGMRSKIKRIDDLNQPLQILSDRGYIRVFRVGKEGQTAGRKKVEYEVSPKFLSASSAPTQFAS